jgi:hypothetical protein
VRKPSFAERIVDVLSCCATNSVDWPVALRADCALIHSRYEALKLDFGPTEAWRRARLEWVKRAIKRSGMVRVAYHFRECVQPERE